MRFFIIFVLLIFITHNCQSKGGGIPKHRKKRFYPVLVFPVTSPTRVMFIGGIGIPLSDLPHYESVITGYVLKASYQIPISAEALKTKGMLPLNAPIDPIRVETLERKFSKRPLFKNFILGPKELKGSAEDLLREGKVALSSYRWTVYKAFEALASRMGLNGRECVLKSICEAAEEPFHFANGMFAELFHILLTPSSSADELSEHSDNEYFHAELAGRSGAKCDHVFKDCPNSLLSRFSELHELGIDLAHIVG